MASNGAVLLIISSARATYSSRGQSAAGIFERLRAYEPENSDWANNAGFFSRDASVELEFEGSLLCRAARGELQDQATLAELRQLAGVAPELRGTPAEKPLFAAAADERIRRARELMERSYAAYLDAARLVPEDVRVVNDTALVLVYYLHTDLDRAEELLMRCVRMGEEQLADASLGEDQRWELENAWGDAFQNLGVMHLVLKNDPATARRYFERSVEIGPEPRPVVREIWIPKCNGESVDHPESLAILGWAQPCELEGDR